MLINVDTYVNKGACAMGRTTMCQVKHMRAWEILVGFHLLEVDSLGV